MDEHRGRSALQVAVVGQVDLDGTDQLGAMVAVVVDDRPEDLAGEADERPAVGGGEQEAQHPQIVEDRHPAAGRNYWDGG